MILASFPEIIKYQGVEHPLSAGHADVEVATIPAYDALVLARALDGRDIDAEDQCLSTRVREVLGYMARVPAEDRRQEWEQFLVNALSEAEAFAWRAAIDAVNLNDPPPEDDGNQSHVVEPTPPTADDVAAWLRLVVEPGSVVEFRAVACVDNPIYPAFITAGWFDHDHLDELARAAMEWTGTAEGCYVTINPVDPALLARAANRVKPRQKKTTTDADTVRRVGLVFDADPVRPAGISATEAEKALARERIDRLTADLTAQGWPAPILADSGNGFHARYRIDLPADDGGLVERVLKGASAKFTDRRVKIDDSIWNPSRVIKLHGTLSRKGDSVPDRPHRWSRVLSIPSDFQVVSMELLEALAAEAPVIEAHGPNGSGNRDRQRMTVVGGPSPEARARAYVFALGFPDSIAGQGGHGQLYHAAAVLVDGFGLTFDQALPIFEDWNAAKAQPPEDEKQVRHKLSDAVKNHPVPSLKLLNADRSNNGTGKETPTRTAPPAASMAGVVADPATFVLVTSRASEYRVEPVEFLDGGSIPTKLITIAGLGGAGKGMFWANIVADLTRGRPTLGLACQPGPPIDVLLVGCEDGYSDTVIPRLMAADADRERVHILEGIRDSKGHVLPFSLANLKPLEGYLATQPAVRLVIIDPITGYVGRAGVKDHHDAELRSLLEPLGDLANRLKITILTIKHLNKDEAKTVSSRVGGSIAYVNVPRACALIALDPSNEARRVLAWFKWNLNAEIPSSIAWTMEPAPPDRVAAILAGCDNLGDENKAKLARQLHCLKWVGEVDLGADDLLRTAARIERKSSRNEVDRATEWLSQFLADGPVGSIVCARDGDAALDRPWPAPNPNHTPDEIQRRVLGRVKWWRETILKKHLEGETARAGFQGSFFFRLRDHLTRGLWPPTAAVILAAKQADDSATRPAREDEAWSTPIEALHRSLRNKGDSMASMASMDSMGDHGTGPAGNAYMYSTDSMKGSGEAEDVTVVDHPVRDRRYF